MTTQLYDEKFVEQMVVKCSIFVSISFAFCALVFVKLYSFADVFYWNLQIIGLYKWSLLNPVIGLYVIGAILWLAGPIYLFIYTSYYLAKKAIAR